MNHAYAKVNQINFCTKNDSNLSCIKMIHTCMFGYVVLVFFESRMRITLKSRHTF